jgi:hypothetical protein
MLLRIYDTKKRQQILFARKELKHRTRFDIIGFSVTIIRQCVYKNNLDGISTQIVPQLIGLSSFPLSFFFFRVNKKASNNGRKALSLYPMNDVENKD